MSVVIRLSKTGKKGEAKYRVVVTEKRSRRDGKPIEELGWFEKTTKGSRNDIDRERYNYWISKGAQPTNTVFNLLKMKI